jgi:quercetin dioxygenase-like cupin family protein
MTATMICTERLTAGDEHVPARSKWPMLAVAFGLLLMAVTGAVLVADAVPTTEAREAAADTFPTIGTSTNSYPPGHVSGWHVHPGVHSVVVLSGTLTVYDEHCVRTEYGPGQMYLGGSKPHVAHNEAADVLDVTITFVHRAAGEDPGTAVPTPAGCNLR